MLNRLNLFLFTGLVAVFAGCGQQAIKNSIADPNVSTADTKDSDSSAADEHAHAPGAHGGNIISIGRDSYHAEAVFERGGDLKLYTLGQDETKVLEVNTQTLPAHVKADNESESVAITLHSDTQADDTEGKTSVFTGKVPEDLQGKSVSVTIPSIKIGADRYRIAFSSQVEAHGSEEMPSKVADDEEKSLYLTPGGKYTVADIEANGNVTASQKFRGFKAEHDLHPKGGDQICPVTLTKANPKCSWIVDGKTYEFCCPPCVDEFVKMAKENPGDMKEPDAYVKR